MISQPCLKLLQGGPFQTKSELYPHLCPSQIADPSYLQESSPLHQTWHQHVGSIGRNEWKSQSQSSAVDGTTIVILRTKPKPCYSWNWLIKDLTRAFSDTVQLVSSRNARSGITIYCCSVLTLLHAANLFSGDIVQDQFFSRHP